MVLSCPRGWTSEVVLSGHYLYRDRPTFPWEDQIEEQHQCTQRPGGCRCPVRDGRVVTLVRHPPPPACNFILEIILHLPLSPSLFSPRFPV